MYSENVGLRKTVLFLAGPIVVCFALLTLPSCAGLLFGLFESRVPMVYLEPRSAVRLEGDEGLQGVSTRTAERTEFDDDELTARVERGYTSLLLRDNSVTILPLTASYHGSSLSIDLCVGSTSEDTFCALEACTFTATELCAKPLGPQRGRLNSALTPEWFWLMGDDEYWARKDMVRDESESEGTMYPRFRVFREGTGGGARYRDDLSLAHIPAGQTATIRFFFRVSNVAEADLDMKFSEDDICRTYRFHFVHARETKPF